MRILDLGVGSFGIICLHLALLTPVGGRFVPDVEASAIWGGPGTAP